MTAPILSSLVQIVAVHASVQDGLTKHLRLNMRFTPTLVSWLNMVERFFRKITVNRLCRGVFISVPALTAAIDRYVAHHNTQPKPFIRAQSAADILQTVIRANSRLRSKQNATLHLEFGPVTKSTAPLACMTTPPFVLRLLSLPDLQDLAAARVPAAWAEGVDAAALPPPFVAARSLRQLADGKPAAWCLGFLVLRAVDQHIVGACGFKNTPHDGRVEIGYGVAPDHRGQGAASAAVRQLLALAFAGGAGEVLAEVNPDNIASTRLVQRLGFVAHGTRVDEDGETLRQWLARPALHLS